MQVNMHGLVKAEVQDFTRYEAHYSGDFVVLNLKGDGGEVQVFVNVENVGDVSAMLDKARQHLNAIARKGD